MRMATVRLLLPKSLNVFQLFGEIPNQVNFSDGAIVSLMVFQRLFSSFHCPARFQTLRKLKTQKSASNFKSEQNLFKEDL